MKTYSIPEIYEVYKNHPHISTDTRTLSEGDIYVALKGENFNGNQYVLQALEQGAAFCITDEKENNGNDKIIQVDHALNCLQLLAKHHREQLNIPVIGITGSNGKTTTKELCTAVLESSFNTISTKGNLNNHIGVPLTLLAIPADAEIAIIEMGANHEHEIDQYCEWAQPTHALINNIGKAHLEGFGSLEGVKRAKGELFQYVMKTNGTIFVNTDLPYLIEMSEGYKKIVTYGTKKGDYPYLPLQQEIFASIASLKSGAECSLHSRLIGSYNAPNLMAAATIGLYFGLSIDAIKKEIEAYVPENNRSQLIEKNTTSIILDAYNANPSSMRSAIQNFAQLPHSNKIVWLGAMKELGADERKEHLELIKLVNQYQWKQVVLVGVEFEGIAGNHVYFDKVEHALPYLSEINVQHAAVLIKGSRGSRMEKLLGAFN